MAHSTNGTAKVTIKILKCQMQKYKVSGEDLPLGILNFLNTSIEGLNTRPAQTLFGQRTMSITPIEETLLKIQLSMLILGGAK